VVVDAWDNEVVGAGVVVVSAGVVVEGVVVVSAGVVVDEVVSARTNPVLSA
jgi:hypothetical protein